MTVEDDVLLTVGIAQIAPVWLERAATLAKVIQWIDRAAAQGCGLVAFAEALVPGYPFWLEWTGGARFDDAAQKDLFALYSREAVRIEAGHLDGVCAAAARHGIAVVLGIVERAGDRSGHSLYCSLVVIDAAGRIASVHRKLMPTFEERLVWSPGDGHGLVVHRLGAFTLGALNCFENWMPLARAALHAQGEDLHVAIWPGNARNTERLTPVLAQEGRSYVLSASALLSRADVPADHPAAAMLATCPDVLADGGSCIAAPDGSWLIAPVTAREDLLVATLDPREVRRARQNFDSSGHYSRADVTQLIVDRRRQAVARFIDG